MKPLDGEALRQFQSQLDDIPELRGAGIAFIGDGRCVALRIAQHSSGLDTYVILQEDQNGTVPRPPPSIVPEAVGLGINCLGAFFSWAALLGEVVAAPMTGGASGVLAVASVGAVTATSIQCAAAIFRTSDVAFNKGSLVEWLDSQDWYAWAAGFLDGVSLGGAALSTSAAVRAVMGVRRVSSRSFSEILRGMSRQERKRLTEDILRMQAVPLKKNALKQLIRAGKVASRFSAKEINRRIFTQLADAISAALECAGSATSGDLKSLYVHIVQE